MLDILVVNFIKLQIKRKIIIIMVGLSIDRCAQKREKKKEANRLAEGWKRKQAMRSALSYLYSYRCMGKVGNLLARPPPSLPLPIFNPSLLLLFQRPTLATSRVFAGHKYKKLAGTNRSATIYCIWVLGFVNRGNVPLSRNRRSSPSLSSLRFELCLAVGRYLFPRNKRHESRLPPLRVLLRRYQKRM